MKQTFEAFDATRALEDKPFKALCYAPSVQLTFSPNGDASACCISRSYVLGNVRTHRLDEIWHGERLRRFREELRRYQLPAGCETCYWQLEAGNFETHPIRSFDGFAVHPDEEWPAVLEFAVSNTCNLACIQCCGDYSSVLRAQEGLPPLAKAYDDQFFADLRKYLPHLQNVSFLGGEPFLQQECYRIWDMLIDMELAPACSITTNGSLYNAKVERVLSELPVNLCISIDGITKETIERIRVNVKYETLMDNIRRFDAYAKGRADRHADKRQPWIQFNYCVMRQNWHELADLCIAPGFLDSDLKVIISTQPRPGRRSRVALEPGCDSRTSPASTARCTSA